ncbi:unnamed protein product [Cladocopium goreaui]|uniref:Nucleotide-diphospho-sugar transferase domain-containing protein n=1 Tax=Cladocopium goreaui TaxID=2562237 RepID=A0A9P1DFE1_9DINO|nr:unnamed protein product [Cladocopium goreaui]
MPLPFRFHTRQNKPVLLCSFVGMVIVSVFAAAWYRQSISSVQSAPRTMTTNLQTSQSYSSTMPFQFRFQICNGLTNQKLQILDGVLVALFLGAQIVLPKMIALNGAQFLSITDMNMQPTDRIFNMRRFENKIQQTYSNFWCRRREHQAFKIWCSDNPPPAILYDTNIDIKNVNVEHLKLKPDEWGQNALTDIGDAAFMRIFEDKRFIMDKSILRITEPCEFWFNVKVKEGTDFWDEFWKIQDVLEFNDQIVELGENAKRIFLHNFGGVARAKAKKHGYKVDDESIQHGGFHVVHLRAEKDWQNHCERWFSWIDRRDNCMNNTWHIGNVLLSEGISPALPVYLATGLSETDVRDLRNIPSMHSFFNIYTVVTKAMLGLTTDVGEEREYWAAVDFILGRDAEWFVGNSISTFSALMMEFRARRKMPVLPYNAGKMALEEIDCIRPNKMTLIPPVRPVIKWLFILPQNVEQYDVVYNMTMAAVNSALSKTRVVPVCVTTADPYSAIVVRLASMGVRIIHHTPKWTRDVNRMVERWNSVGERSFFQYFRPLKAEEVIARWLRIDLPMLGLLDDFALYTDVSVVFTDDVNWMDLLGENHLNLARSMERKMFPGPFFNNYAPPGKLGVPRFFAVPDSKNTRHSGVMLMNLKNLRQSYSEFSAFVINEKQLLKIDGVDPCSYLEFYEETSLPLRVGWKPHQPENNSVSLVHFYGPNCQVDIFPYLRTGHVRFELYRGDLEMCAQERSCAQLCRQYENYLNDASDT